MLCGCFSCLWGGLRGSWGHLGAQSWIFIDFDGSPVNFCTPLAPHVGVHFVVMSVILRQNLVAFCLLAWKRLLHRFSMFFWECRNLHFLSLVGAKMQFCHFGRRRCWHRFWHQKLFKMEAKMVPRGSHEAPRSMWKTMCKRSVKKTAASHRD